MAEPRIAVLGSCVTRDIWWALNLPPSEPALFVGRTSLASASLAESRVNVLAPLTDLVPQTCHGFTRAMVMTELSKTAFDQIAAAKPDTLVLDFIDERFDLLACDGVPVTESLELIESGMMAQPALAQARRIPRFSDEAWSLWTAGLLRLRRAFDEARLPPSRIVLHACLWADVVDSATGRHSYPDRYEIMLGRPTSRAANNDLLRRMHDTFATSFPEAVVIEPPADLRVADAAHRWGFAPFHFIPQYYQSLASTAAYHGVPLRSMIDTETTCFGA